MNFNKSHDFVSVEEYLEGEPVSTTKYEYVDGNIYAMADVNNRHNLIAANLLIALGTRLRGHKFRVFNSDTKIRIRLPSETRFYYPDVSVIGRSNPQYEFFQDKPVAVFEVLSQKSHRFDEVEKNYKYQTIKSLMVCVLVHQDFPGFVVFRRRADEFVREICEEVDGLLSLPEIKVTLPLAEIYEGVDFSFVEKTEEEETEYPSANFQIFLYSRPSLRYSILNA